ncbi:hypothetical protein CSC62_13990 [Pseudoxanthomonas jiangsuensis]|uniref:hypothetical protein n=1 Tax=Pseudoxanthomonas jiangsuensis TaxID=619688 RepID=UPI001390FE90|nr:hypothetical protein [Pseudoxanthomonas jiangsuensis]KAF1692741.1 hypothetical protein CSC62_13990 [Pseudoxanthomonas jiangsuensis]
MRATCPDCGAQAHLSAFFVEDDGKRLAALLAEMQPELGRAVIAYLGLFKPPKNALRLSRAVKLVQELAALVATGDVCKDERTGVRRPATPTTWAIGIETMLAQRAALSLPLESHGYLRAVVYGLADKADAAAERQREESARAGRHLTSPVATTPAPGNSPYENHMRWIKQTEDAGGFTAAEAEEERRKTRERYGVTE